MTKSNLLASAIADAEQLKKVAVANAKAALTESFDGALNDMVKNKLAEDASEEDVAEEVDEKKKAEVEVPEEDAPEAEDDDAADTDESFDISAILAEIEGEEVDEKKKAPVAAEEKPKAKEDETDLDEEIDLNQLLNEISCEDDENDKVEEDDDVLEITDDEDSIDETFENMASTLGLDIATVKEMAAKAKASKVAKTPENEVTELQEQVARLEKVIAQTNLVNAKTSHFTKLVNENSSLTNQNKVEILSVFDKAKSQKEVTLVYESLSKALKTKKVASTKKSLAENLGLVSKATGAVKKENIVENSAFARMQALAGRALND